MQLGLRTKCHLAGFFFLKMRRLRAGKVQLEVSRMISKSSDFSFDIVVVGFMVYIANPQRTPRTSIYLFVGMYPRIMNEATHNITYIGGSFKCFLNVHKPQGRWKMNSF